MTDNSRNKKRPSIYLSPPLNAVVNALKPNQTLSARLATIAERYQLVCRDVPDLNERERELLGSVLSGTHIEPLLIRHLDDEIEDSNAGNADELMDLAARIRGMSNAQRVSLIESLGF